MVDAHVPAAETRLALGPTPRDVVWTDGTACLLRFRRQPPPRPSPRQHEDGGRAPVLLVPSLINRWYVLDLHAGASVVAALSAAGLDVYCLDWGAPEAEDRFLEWDDVVARLERGMRRVRRLAGTATLSLVGYCMGATLATIATALAPETVAGLVNLAGPIDFAAGGALRRMVDARFFDAGAVAEAGNVAPEQMQSGFVALRPTAALAKWLRSVDPDVSDDARARADALERWASDNVAFPGAAYRRYIGDLYQRNELVRGEHRIAGRPVALGAIRGPILTVVADRDAICPPPAALALHRHAASRDTAALTIAGGHVGAIVGARATRDLYPRLCEWLTAREGGSMRA